MERLCLKCLHDGGDPPHEGGGMEERTGDQRERANADVSTGRRSSAVAGSLRELFLAADA